VLTGGILRGQRLAAFEWRETFLVQIVLRTLLIVALLGGLLAAFILIAAGKADELAVDRQQHLIATVIEQSFRTIEHDQEASTVWDDAVEQMNAPTRDDDWIDRNLGIWFYTYYGHDEVFIVDGADRIIYAMRSGRREGVPAYAKSIGTTVTPLMSELRGKMRNSDNSGNDATVLSPGASDLGTVHGHPAMISVKPIVPETDDIVVKPGSQYLHVSIRYLDRSFAAALARRYELADGHFAKAPPDDSKYRQIPLRARSGSLLGYFVWEPFRPGTAMLGELAPALIVALLFVFVIVAWLLHRISHRTLQLSVAKSHALHLANHDPLTGLANRALFDRRLGREQAQLDLTGRSLALLYVDLDHFKNVNDHLGHPTGDLLIRAMARILLDLAPGDVVARLGGDEFAIIHVADDAASSAEQLAQSIHRALARPIDLGDGEVLIGASIGIAVAPGDGHDPVELVRKADIALYDAKLTGRRRHSFFTPEMGDRIRERHEIEAELREAMRAGEGLRVVYQPYFGARSGEMIGAEALIRWDHPLRGPMLPEQFIPTAEECGLIETLNEWVLEQACIAAARWPAGIISVNLSAVQLRNPTLAERIYTIVKRARLSPSRLELEITETSFLESSEKCRRNLGWLRDIGVRIALDEFGTGYSSFKHLRGFEIDRIKIDRSFVSTIQLGQGGSPVIQAIIDLARVSALSTIADGVETEQQQLFLTSIGCDALQGILLAEPVEAADLEARFLGVPARPRLEPEA